jgi:peroxiredoxin
VRLYGVSMDKPAESRDFAEKLAADKKGAISFPLLSDLDHGVIDGYGLRDPAYTGKQFEGIPHPSVYVIDKDGRVAWAKVEDDYTRRPTNQEIRAALDGLR